MDQCRVEDTVFCEVDINYNLLNPNCTRTAKFAHMNGHWKDYDFMELFYYNIRMYNNDNNDHTALVLVMVVIVCVLFE